MAETAAIFGSGIGLMAALALVDPALMGWRRRRDAVVMLVPAVLLLVVAWLTA